MAPDGQAKRVQIASTPSLVELKALGARLIPTASKVRTRSKALELAGPACRTNRQPEMTLLKAWACPVGIATQRPPKEDRLASPDCPRASGDSDTGPAFNEQNPKVQVRTIIESLHPDMGQQRQEIMGHGAGFVRPGIPR